MPELKWLDPLPEHSLEGGIKLLNEPGWNLQVPEIDALFFVNAGYQVVLKTSSRESLEALFYAMGLATP